MSRYFAELDAADIVIRVIVAEPEFVATLPGTWVETFSDGGPRRNYAGIGYKYHRGLDAFHVPQPHPSFVLDPATARWKAPKDKPQDGAEYVWDEKANDWKKEKKA